MQHSQDIAGRACCNQYDIGVYDMLNALLDTIGFAGLCYLMIYVAMAL